MEANLIPLNKQLQEFFKEVIPLRNLQILHHQQASEILAIFLSLDAQSFHTFWKTQTLQKLCESFCKTLSFKGVMQVQYTLLLNLQNAFLQNPKTTQELLKATLANLAILKRENLANNTLLDAIEEYFEALIHAKIPQEVESKPSLSQAFVENFLDASVELLQEQTNKLQGYAQDLEYLLPSLKQLESLLQKTQNPHFSLGVTGVLSAGKSTFLNTLLGEEVLGTSTIPETASLTLLKYAKTPSARVSFWNAREWEDLQSTMDVAELNTLLENPQFTQELQTHVQEITQTLQIPIQELPKYTSANHPSKMCYLVKETTLLTPLEFLQHHVEIVDTPGLDDPIIQREEITKGYLRQCDLLIHVMNASQSATQIDRDFIIEALQNANLSRILIVLTHADLLEAKELQAALAYTRESLRDSIEMALKDHGQEELDLLFKRLDFLTIASYPALIARSNPQKAKALGYSLEDSNFIALLDYLNATLLGKSSTKAKDSIYLCAQGFRRVYQGILDAIALERSLLFVRESEVEEKITQAKEERLQSQNALLSAKYMLDAIREQLQEFSLTLQKQLQQKLHNAQDILGERVFSDIIYEYEKGKIPTKERMEYLLDFGLKDLLSEILRFCAQSLEKKISQLSLQFQSQSIGLGEALEQRNFNLVFNPTLLQKTKLKILQRILKSAKSFSKSKQDLLQIALQEDFQEGLLEFIQALHQESALVEDRYIAHFTHLLESAQQQLEQDLQARENILENALKHLHTTAGQKAQREEVLQEILACVKAQMQECLMLQDYATRGEHA